PAYPPRCREAVLALGARSRSAERRARPRLRRAAPRCPKDRSLAPRDRLGAGATRTAAGAPRGHLQDRCIARCDLAPPGSTAGNLVEEHLLAAPGTAIFSPLPERVPKGLPVSEPRA